MGLKVVVVGGVAGGASAAARLRRLREDAEIVVFEKGEYISFANCGLPYYIGEVITKKEKLVIQTPESMKKRFNLDIRVNTEVVSIDRNRKTVMFCNKLTGEIAKETYDKLIISTGAVPMRFAVPGGDHPRIFTIRDIPDTYRIKECADHFSLKNAVIVGAGYIGLEMAENLHALGINVTIVERNEHVIGPIDYEMAAIVHQQLQSKGIDLYLKDSVQAFESKQDTITTILSSGERIEADIVVMATGVRPETRLASDSGLDIGTAGGILVDETMCTSDPDIYAVGDAAEVNDFVNGTPALISLAGPANKQGRIAANNICGHKEKYTGTQGTSIVKVFDLTVAATGSNERKLKALDREYQKSFTHSASHATYYPGSSIISIMLLFDKVTGKILGAQAVGNKGVDKRIDVLATAIRAGMTVNDLERLELSYAPPFSSAKDPVNMAGYVASNILKGDVSIYHWNELPEREKEDAVLIDVRTRREFEQGSINGAINIPVDNLREQIELIPPDKHIYIFCQVGLRGYLACRILMQKGYNHVKNLSGGYRTYNLMIGKNEGK